VDEDLTHFCRAEYPRLVGALSLYCGDRHVAEELAQDAIVRVISDWPKVRRFQAPGAWAHRVAINLANSHLRRRLAERRAKQRLFAYVPRIHHDPDTPTALAIREIVASLPKRQRAVVVLRFFADLSVREVADLLDCPEGTVKSLTAKALSSLRATSLGELKEVSDAI
jgi:RNA polymerase sigma-70 factor (sigma-E family)